MSSIIDDIYAIHYNPFKYGDYMASFYNGLDPKENNILLSQLVIPLCSHPIFSQRLKNIRKNSTLWTIFGKREEFFDLQERIDEFKNLTEQTIYYCLANEWLDFNSNNLMLIFNTNNNQSFVVQKNAAQLARLLSDYSIVEIYDFLGVQPR